MPIEVVLMRHGHSRPNQHRMIVSAVENGAQSQYGLSDSGIAQVRQTTVTLRRYLDETGRVLFIFSSPFSRALETARIVQGAVDVPASRFFVRAELRERFFGSLELQSDACYPAVWEFDRDNRTNPFGAESTDDVWRRVSSLIALVRTIVPATTDAVALFVAHGDTLQIAECTLRGRKPHQHRRIDHLHQAQWRPMPEQKPRPSKL